MSARDAEAALGLGGRHMSLHPDVQELLDRSRIADTIYAYCDCVDDGDLDGVLGLFASNGVIDLGGGAIHRGHDELRELFADRFRLYTTTSFHCSGVRMVQYGTSLCSTSTDFYGIHDAVDQDSQMHLWGRWEDEMIKKSDSWVFRRRHLRVAALSHQPVAEVPPRFNRIRHAPLNDSNADNRVMRLVSQPQAAHAAGRRR